MSNLARANLNAADESGIQALGTTERTAPVAAAHVPVLDGVRGLAVALVLLFHLTWTFPDTNAICLAVKRVLWMGWIGVDVFFVLSGYLITRGLVRAAKAPVAERLRHFWARRVLRIFPLYYVVLALGSVIALVTGAFVPGASYWLYGQNYTLAFDHDPLVWTAHLWSLAIEEQFYFVWPLLVFLVPVRARMPVVVVAFAFAVLGRATLVLGPSPCDATTTAKLVYRATATHMDGLLAGSLVAMMAADPGHAISRFWQRARSIATPMLVLALVCLMVATKGFATYDRRVLVLGLPILALAVAAIVEAAVEGRLPTKLGAVLASPALRALGKYSYGMYVLHWPLVVVAAPALARLQAGLDVFSSALVSLLFLAVGFTLSFGAAVASFHVLEVRFLKHKTRFEDA